MMCQLLGVSPSGYYAWVSRQPSARSLQDAALTVRIKKIHEESRATYGVPRVHFDLAVEGVRVGQEPGTGLAAIGRQKRR
jgi:putative transposase